MDFIIELIHSRPSLFVGILGLFLIFNLWIFYIFLYIYVNINLKGICKIIFNDENYYTKLLEPFNFLFISMFPSVFWRETLNIKYNILFKKMYGRNIYNSIDENKLKNIISSYPVFFVLQYIVFFSGILGMFFLFLAYFLEKYL